MFENRRVVRKLKFPDNNHLKTAQCGALKPVYGEADKKQSF
jgi:hypothetical protein